MHPFEYLPARNLTEAISALARHGDRARAFAGGTDLLVQLRGGRYELDAIVDLKRIPEVMELRLDGDGLHIGAALPCTIVIPVYNAPDEVAACIASVIKHTNLQETQVLVIDDNSPDGTGRWCDQRL